MGRIGQKYGVLTEQNVMERVKNELEVGHRMLLRGLNVLYLSQSSQIEVDQISQQLGFTTQEQCST